MNLENSFLTNVSFIVNRVFYKSFKSLNREMLVIPVNLNRSKLVGVGESHVRGCFGEQSGRPAKRSYGSVIKRWAIDRDKRECVCHVRTYQFHVFGRIS